MATAARGSNRFAIWISVAVVAAIAIVIALVVWMNNAASAPAPRPDGAGINQETGAILAGSGPNEITVYFDFYCPHCQDFEDLYGDVINEAAFTSTGNGVVTAVRAIDDHGIDAVANGTGTAFSRLGQLFKRVESGYVRSYALTMVAGSVLIGVVLILGRLA